MASAGGWALAARVVAQGAQLAVFLVAARFLTPADFGVFAMTMAASNLLFIFGAAGWREVILSWRGNARAIDMTISYAFLSGYVTTAIGIACAAVAVLVFKAPTLSLLILALAAAQLVGPLAHALGGVLIRRGAVAGLSAMMIIAELAGLAAAVAGFFADLSILALGVAKLTTQLILFFGVALIARQPLRIILDGAYRTQILDVSKSILANRFIGFVFGNSSTFIIGAFLGAASVGYFRAAERVISAVSQLLSEPIRLISWMVFRQAAEGSQTENEVKENLSREGKIIFTMMIFLATPVLIGLAIVSDDVVLVLLGENWAPVAPVLAILALAHLLTVPMMANEPLLTIAGKVKVLPPVMLFNAVATVAIFTVFSQFGMIAAAVGRIAANSVALGTSVWVQVRHAGAHWWGAVKAAGPVYTGAIAMTITVVSADQWMMAQDIAIGARLAAEILAGAVVYFLVIAIVRPSFIRNTFWL